MRPIRHLTLRRRRRRRVEWLDGWRNGGGDGDGVSVTVQSMPDSQPQCNVVRCERPHGFCNVRTKTDRTARMIQTPNAYMFAYVSIVCGVSCGQTLVSATDIKTRHIYATLDATPSL